MNEYIKRLRECLRDGSNDPQSPEHWRVWLGKILSDMEKAKPTEEAGLVEAKAELLDIAGELAEVVEMHDPNNIVLDKYNQWHEKRYADYRAPLARPTEDGLKELHEKKMVAYRSAGGKPVTSSEYKKFIEASDRYNEAERKDPFAGYMLGLIAYKKKQHGCYVLLGEVLKEYLNSRHPTPEPTDKGEDGLLNEDSIRGAIANILDMNDDVAQHMDITIKGEPTVLVSYLKDLISRHSAPPAKEGI